MRLAARRRRGRWSRARWRGSARAGRAALLAAVGTPYMALMAATGPDAELPGAAAGGGAACSAGLRGAADREPRREPRRAGALVGLVCGLAIWDSALALPALAGAGAGPRSRRGCGRGLRAVAALRGRRWPSALAPLLVARAVGASGVEPGHRAAAAVALDGRRARPGSRAAPASSGSQVPLVVDGPERAALPLALAVAARPSGCVLAASRLRRDARAPGRSLGWAVGAGRAPSRSAAARAATRCATCSASRCRSSRCARRGRRARLRGAAGAGWPRRRPGRGRRRALARRATRMRAAAWRDPAHAAAVWQVPPLDAGARHAARARACAARTRACSSRAA